MIQAGTRLKVIDNSGAKEIECIDVLKLSDKRTAEIGNFIIASVKKARTGGSVSKKDVVRAIIVRQRKPKRRNNGVVVRFDDNAAILVSENLNELVGNRISGPVPYEVREIMPSVASIAAEIV
jgi:large subunit ribosomal protein L14